MRIKTSVSLSEELLDEIGRAGVRGGNRSEFLERAAWDRIAFQKESERARDRRILDRHAKRLNAEALDVLEYQADW